MKPKYNMSIEENIFVAKRNLVDYIWKNANLEGINVTYPETQAICHGVSVSGYSIDEINAVSDLKYAWHYLLDNIHKPLDLEYIKQVHMKLGKCTIVNAGVIRCFDAVVSRTNRNLPIPDEKQLATDIKNILNREDYKQDIALNMMLYLIKSQLFYDGNQRLAMLICNKIMIENGLGIVSISQKYIQEFYALLEDFFTTENGENLKDFLYKNCIDGMQF